MELHKDIFNLPLNKSTKTTGSMHTASKHLQKYLGYKEVIIQLRQLLAGVLRTTWSHGRIFVKKKSEN